MKCTAPVRGHKSPAQAASCPVHRKEGVSALKGLTPATLSGLSPEDRLSAAGVTDVEPAALEVLAKDSHVGVRCAVANNPSTSRSVFLELMDDPAFEVRTAVASRTDLTPGDMVGMMDDTYQTYALAKNPATPEDLLFDLLNSKDPATRLAAASNSSTPLATVMRFYHLGHDAEIAEALGHRRDTPEEALSDIAQRTTDERLLTILALHPRAGIDTFRVVALSESVEARTALGRARKTPDDVIDTLTKDPVDHIREHAIKVRNARICKRFGIKASNRQAIDSIALLPWWATNKNSPEIQIVLAVHADL